MAAVSINETSIPSIYAAVLYQSHTMNIAAEHTSKILDVLVSGVSSILHDIKSKEHPVAIMINKAPKETFICAAIVEYYPNEDASKPGEWGYSWTFDESDIPENTSKVNLNDPSFSGSFRTIGSNKYKMGFDNPSDMNELFWVLMDTISQYLQENAKDGEVTEVTLENVVTFRSDVEDGAVVKSIDLDGEIKQMIKDDSSIEK